LARRVEDLRSFSLREPHSDEQNEILEAFGFKDDGAERIKKRRTIKFKTAPRF
jgi:hypothetical protein